MNPSASIAVTCVRAFALFSDEQGMENRSEGMKMALVGCAIAVEEECK